MKDNDTKPLQVRSLVNFLQVGMQFVASASLSSLHIAWESERSVYCRRQRRPVGYYGLGELTVACIAIKIKLWCLKMTPELESGTRETNTYMHENCNM